MNVRVGRMSRGMKQKLGIILALAHRPDLLVLDEPTSGLDPIMQDNLTECLREMAAAGHTVFFSSHRLSEVERLCDRIAIVRRGRIVADASLEALRSRARRQVVLLFADGAATGAMSPPAGLHLVERGPTGWRGELEGSPVDLVRWAAQQPIRDVSISPPDLDALFRQFYHEIPEPEAGA